ncbi:hypothetical protein [Paenibacillus polymyxa]|uniref:hypothetical protein n=1 Tax=Paenibacillus polymyxa TaxID=1406 RepID=UPI001868A50B|nr:hypothetical protein [Paenibacillus polymyxa]MBE3650490.1 hypothetical protein [Paenibacillus polymyxa]MDN4086177.1 hypothetical protein [Paenibacillus polymyxa]MDN4087066.1 hypothetical protein [Paenibacillus polymyxa]MDN4108687.1 hypothetical protein [Paenibacillus polymyxa]
MKKIMDASLAFESKDEGTIIVGTNKELDHLTYPEIKKIIGDKILIKNANQNEVILNVSSIQISTSMAERRNIGICIGKLASPDLVQVGASIYSLEN